jgi:hypothetical protein
VPKMDLSNNLTQEHAFFVVFCIEAIAEELKMTGDEVYKLLTDDSDILDNYIIPCYDALHTQGKDYITDDIIRFMKEQGVIG